MNMVIHQTVMPYLHILFSKVVVKDMKIGFIVFFMEGNDLAAVTWLDDMVRAAEDDNASDSTHFIPWNE